VRKLTDIQLRMLRYLDSGMSSEEISNLTMTNPSTVRNHISRIMKKSRCRSLFQLGRWAMRNGYLQVDTKTVTDRELRV